MAHILDGDRIRGLWDILWGELAVFGGILYVGLIQCSCVVLRGQLAVVGGVLADTLFLNDEVVL